MSTTSTVPAFKTALVEALRARPGLAGVQVGYVWRGPAAEAEGIYLAGVTLASELADIRAGRKPRQENYTLEVVVYGVQGGRTSAEGDAADVEARSYELLGELDGCLADDPRLIDAIQWATLAGVRDENGPVPVEAGWGSVLVATVDVAARLS